MRWHECTARARELHRSSRARAGAREQEQCTRAADAATSRLYLPVDYECLVPVAHMYIRVTPGVHPHYAVQRSAKHLNQG
jgi:hypothetical protein